MLAILVAQTPINMLFHLLKSVYSLFKVTVKKRQETAIVKARNKQKKNCTKNTKRFSWVIQSSLFLCCEQIDFSLHEM